MRYEYSYQGRPRLRKPTAGEARSLLVEERNELDKGRFQMLIGVFSVLLVITKFCPVRSESCAARTSGLKVTRSCPKPRDRSIVRSPRRAGVSKYHTIPKALMILYGTVRLFLAVAASPAPGTRTSTSTSAILLPVGYGMPQNQVMMTRLRGEERETHGAPHMSHGRRSNCCSC